MKFIKITSLVTFGVIIALFVLSKSSVFGQRNAPVYKPTNRVALEDHDAKAQSYVAKNLNRFGLDKLKDFDKTLDSSFNSELKDTLATMEKSYLTKSSSLQNSLQEQNKKIAELTDQKSKLTERYDKLLRTAAFAFIFWLIIVILFMQFKKRRLRKKESELNITTEQLKFIKANSSTAKSNLDKILKLKNSLHKVSEDCEKLNQLATSIEDNGSNGNEWKSEMANQILTANSICQNELKLSNAFGFLDGEMSLEKEPVEINHLCSDYLNIAIRGIKMNENEFNIQVTHDFEKNLPAIKVNRVAIGNLLLDVLNNAFQSVEEKYNKGVKGYVPKVTISTRILPRFLQIRIRDNGLGMTDQVLQNATTEYFTTQKAGKGGGLGLSQANRIMSELHKGEIKIESENGNSTDVYLKFFL